MSSHIQLLGTPSVVVEGEARPSPSGRKVWALLAYMIESEHATRPQLASLLFPNADDPLRALRWNLTELRRLLQGVATIETDPLRLSLVPGCLVDTHLVRRGSWSEALAHGHLDRELLEGMDFSSSPAFEVWLLNHRRHLRTSCETILREAALALLAAGDTDGAIDAAARLVAIDPLVEESQALLIRSYAAAGDRAAAARQLSACRNLFLEELGIEPGAEVTTAVTTSPASGTSTAAGGRAAAVAQIEAGEAAIRGGATDAGIECLKRAVAESHLCDDVALKTRALLSLGTTLVHAGRESHGEGATALHEALRLTETTADEVSRGRAAFELAWIDFLAARYERAERWLATATEGNESSPEIQAAAAWLLGKIHMETGRYGSSIELLQRAVDLARGAEDHFRHAFALISLGRSHLLRRDLGLAEGALGASLGVIRDRSIVALTPMAESFLAEVTLLDGDTAGAAAMAEHALAFAHELGDASMESAAGRAAGVVAAARGHHEEALRLLTAARMRLVTTPDHTWTMANALDALCGVGVGTKDPQGKAWVADLEIVGSRTGMKEMVVRAYLHKAALGDTASLEAAGLLAADIDNPYLHGLVDSAVDGTGVVTGATSRPS